MATVSTLTNTAIAEYLRIEDASSSDLAQVQEALDAAKQFIKSQTGLSDNDMNNYPDLVIAVKVLCQDMYDNRSYYVDATNVNKVVDSILGQYRQNFLPRNPAPETDNVVTQVNTPVRVNPLANDLAPYGSTIDKVDDQAIAVGTDVTLDHATVEIATNSVLTVVPETDYEGVITFTYSATAPDGSTFKSRVVVVVEGADNAA